MNKIREEQICKSVADRKDTDFISSIVAKALGAASTKWLKTLHGPSAYEELTKMCSDSIKIKMK